jgi:hypothetical protein
VLISAAVCKSPINPWSAIAASVMATSVLVCCPGPFHSRACQPATPATVPGLGAGCVTRRGGVGARGPGNQVGYFLGVATRTLLVPSTVTSPR